MRWHLGQRLGLGVEGLATRQPRPGGLGAAIGRLWNQAGSMSFGCLTRRQLASTKGISRKRNSRLAFLDRRTIWQGMATTRHQRRKAARQRLLEKSARIAQASICADAASRKLIVAANLSKAPVRVLNAIKSPLAVTSLKARTHKGFSLRPWGAR